jgi:AcrR family transcriptional regulator
MKGGFRERLEQAFGHATMAQIARRLGIPHATVRNYFGGRLPAPEVLIKIANETNVSLNWLLMGTGEMYAGVPKNFDLGTILEKSIEEMIDKKLAGRRGEAVQDLGTVDSQPGFDIESALAEYDDPHIVMSEWFRYENREYPQDFGVVFFQGWESFTEAEKLDAIKDAKKVLDRSLRKKY